AAAATLAAAATAAQLAVVTEHLRQRLRRQGSAEYLNRKVRPGSGRYQQTGHLGRCYQGHSRAHNAANAHFEGCHEAGTVYGDGSAAGRRVIGRGGRGDEEINHTQVSRARGRRAKQDRGASRIHVTGAGDAEVVGKRRRGADTCCRKHVDTHPQVTRSAVRDHHVGGECSAYHSAAGSLKQQGV